MGVQSPINEGAELRDEDYLRLIRDSASLDYQKRIPDPTKVSLQESHDAIFSERRWMNEFAEGLFNQLGRVIVRQKSWNNVFGQFKDSKMYHGAAIQEIGVGLTEDIGYSAEQDTSGKMLLGQSLVDIQAKYHRINRQAKYKFTVNDRILRRAFQPGLGGMDATISEIMGSAVISDEWDEFLICSKLFGMYERNHGFYKVQVPDVADNASTGDDARVLLRRIQAVMDNMSFLSTDYNAAGMPKTAKQDEQILFCTPEVKAAIGVEALANAFNLEYAKTYGRIIVLPKHVLDIFGAQAILTSKEFFVMADTLLENTSFANPDGLYQNFWLHHHGIYSYSQFAPAVLFTTQAGTPERIAISPVTEVTTPVVQDHKSQPVTELERGMNYWASAKGVNADGDNMNTEVKFTLTEGTSVHTRVDNDGVIHIGETEETTPLVLTATTAWVNPATGEPAAAKSELSLTVKGATPPAEG